MQTPNQHEKAIRYLGIAVVVISALALIGVVIGLILMAIGQAALNAYGPDIVQQGYDYGRGHHGSAYYGDLSVSDAMSLANFGMGLGYVALIWELATAVVSLVAGILAIRGAADRGKLGGVFGWGIAGAIAAFLGGRLVTCVLLVIVAVFASKDKNAPAYPQAGYGYGAPAAGYGQPAAPAGGYGYGAPAAAPAPVPAQPVDPQAQAYQAAYQQSYGAPVAAAGGGTAAAAAVSSAEGQHAAACDAGSAASAAQPAAAADGAAQAAAAVNAAEAGEAARAAQEYTAGAASAEAADAAHPAADTASVAETADGAEGPKA